MSVALEFVVSTPTVIANAFCPMAMSVSSIRDGYVPLEDVVLATVSITGDSGLPMEELGSMVRGFDPVEFRPSTIRDAYLALESVGAPPLAQIADSILPLEWGARSQADTITRVESARSFISDVNHPNEFTLSVPRVSIPPAIESVSGMLRTIRVFTESILTQQSGTRSQLESTRQFVADRLTPMESS